LGGVEGIVAEAAPLVVWYKPWWPGHAGGDFGGVQHPVGSVVFGVSPGVMPELWITSDMLAI